MHTPSGKEVASILTEALADDVTAELPIHERTPIGPSAILMAGIPRRGMGVDSIHPEPASMEAFSCGVMRESRSATRCSMGSATFR